MRVFALVIFSFLCLASCKSTKHPTIVTKKEAPNTRTSNKVSTNGDLEKEVIPIASSSYELASAIINNAQDYNGVRYKYGGINRKGMDCSGLVYVSFKKENVILPRISRDMAKKGKTIHRSQIKKGDLLFFKTSKKRGSINHVGLVTRTEKGKIEFIHATTSKGVITSSLTENYWNSAFVEARRVL